ncbi:7592_t:CDS:1, partial [Scutellospora calospora]
NIISTIKVDSKFYETIKEDYIKDEHLAQIIRALTDKNDADAKHLKHQIR